MKNDNLSPRLKATYKLVSWVIGLALLFGVISILSNFNKGKIQNKIENNSNDIQVVESSFVEALDRLEKDSFYFDDIITLENETIFFEGKKKENEIIGYWQDNLGIFKCKILNGQLIDTLNEEEKENFEININFLDINYILELIKSVDENSFLVNESKDETKYLLSIPTEMIETQITLIEKSGYFTKISVKNSNELKNYEINLSYIK